MAEDRSKPTSAEIFRPVSALTGNTIIRISIFEAGMWKNYETNFTSLLQWLSTVANPPVAVTSVTGQNSVIATPNPITATGVIQLVNDQAAPGTLKYYGTDAGGSKGFFDLPIPVIADIDVSANPDYPAAAKGDMYRAINGTGRIGGGVGVQADTGDFILCIVTNGGGDQATVGTSWAIISGFDPITKGYGESSLMQTVLSGNPNKSYGDRSMGIGTGSKAVNHNSNARGDTTVAAGNAASSEGKDTVAAGDRSHAEGNGAKTGYAARTFTRSGNVVTIPGNVTAEFIQSSGIAFYDLTGGTNNVVDAVLGLTITSNPVFGGVNTTFNVNFLNVNIDDRTGGLCVCTGLGRDAHSEGGDTQSLGQYSHTEGNFSKTGLNGAAAHAEGFNTQANGSSAHSQGKNTVASADSSHAGGRDTVTPIPFQESWSQGKFAEGGDSQYSTININGLSTGGNIILRWDNTAGIGGTTPVRPVGKTQLWNFYLMVSAIQVSGSAGNVGDSYMLQLAGAIKKVNNVYSVAGVLGATIIYQDADAGVGFAFDVASFNATGIFQFFGEANKTVRVSCSMHISEIAAAMV